MNKFIFGLKKFLKYIVIAILVCSLYLIMGALLPYSYHKTVSKVFKTQFDVQSFYNYNSFSVDRAGLIEDSDYALEMRLRILSQAKNRIVISSFAFKEDSSCKKIFSVIMKKADEGVKVQILADGSTNFMDMEDSVLYKTLASHKNIDIKIYNPINILTPWTLNARMHDKYILIDDKFLLIGGRNTSNYFLGKTNLNNLSYDREVLIYNTAFEKENSKESVITEVYEYFSSVWNYELTKKYNSSDRVFTKYDRESMTKELENIYIDLEKNTDFFKPYDYLSVTVGTNKVSLIHNPIEANNKEPLLWYQLNELMRSAEYRVYIHTPYAVLDKSMYTSLGYLSEHLEEFDILLNSIAVVDNFVASSDYYHSRGELLNTGITIHEFQGDFSMHNKSILIDNDISLIGSYNLDMRSTYLDTETMLVIHSESFNNLLTNEIKRMEKESLTLDKSEEYISNPEVTEKKIDENTNMIFKISSKLFRLVRNLL